MRSLIGEEYTAEHDGQEMICRAELGVLAPEDRDYEKAIANSRIAPMEIKRRADADELERPLSSPGYAWQPLGEFISRHGPSTATLKPPGGGPEQELSLGPLANLDPDTTLVRVGFHCVPRWLYDRERAGGRSAFDLRKQP